MSLSRSLLLCSALLFACDGGEKAAAKPEPAKKDDAKAQSDAKATDTKAAPEKAPEHKPETKEEKVPEPAKPTKADGPTAPVFDAEGELDTSKEMVGELHTGMKPAEVETMLGKPEKTEGPFEEGATGEFLTTWSYPAKGLSLDFSAVDDKGKDIALRGISCSKTCAFGLPWGLKIGSTVADVKKVYGENFDKSATREDLFIAGSVYGGSFYTIENGAVVGIFIGPGAE